MIESEYSYKRANQLMFEKENNENTIVYNTKKNLPFRSLWFLPRDDTEIRIKMQVLLLQLSPHLF